MGTYEDSKKVDVCLACTVTMTGDTWKKCPQCGSDKLIPEKEMPAVLGPRGLAEFTVRQDKINAMPTQDLQDRMYEDYKAEKEKTAAKEKAEQHREHPIDAFGELDYSKPENNPMIPGSPLAADFATGEKEVDYTDPAQNPLIPGSVAKPDFDDDFEEEQIDYTDPKNNLLIPQDDVDTF